MTQKISLTDASEKLGVHYMTAYRYVRTGKLAAEKVGGQWWVAPDDLLDFETGSSSTPRSDIVPPKVADRLVAGDENGTLQLLEGAMASGAHPEEAYLDLLSPAMYIIGERWHAGELTISDEHLATTTALRVTARLGQRSVPRGRSRGSIVLAVVANDQHSVPTALLRDLLRFRGFNPVDLGANTPADSIAQTALGLGDDLVAVGLNATTPGADDIMRSTLKVLNTAVNVPVVVGGSAFRDARHIASLGSCFPTTSAREALDCFEDIHGKAKAG